MGIVRLHAIVLRMTRHGAALDLFGQEVNPGKPHLAATSQQRDRRAVRPLGAMLLLAAMSGSAHAHTYALLVGVSDYPSLAPAMRLQGPRNDVLILKAGLQHRGVPAQNITLLADGIVGQLLPTRQNVLQQIDALRAHARAGDWVILYFSGHGSQQPQRDPRAWAEPDRRDEIFLPYDIGRWDGQVGSVRHALVDDDIGVALRQFALNGISVWSIFDTCHAGGMSKAWDPAQSASFHWRSVPPQLLGVPDASEPAPAGAKGFFAQRRLGSAPAPDRVGGTGLLVAFYASRYDEPAPEEPMPGSGGRAVHGVFTWHLVKALSNGQIHSFDELLWEVQHEYRLEQRSFPSPNAEGRTDLRLPFGADRY